MFRFQPGGCGAPCGGFLFGAPPCFACGLHFSCLTGECCRFGNLFGADFFHRQIRCATFGIDTFARKVRDFFFFFRSGARCFHEFRRGKFASLRVGRGALFGFNARTQCHFRQAFGVRLLCQCGLCRCIGFRTAAGLRCREFFSLLASFKCGSVFGRGQLT